MKINVRADRVTGDDIVPKLLILIPAYNEAPNLEALFTNLKTVDLPLPADVLVVNDGSVDETGEFLRENGINHMTALYNLGYGCSLQAGYKYAVRRNYTYIIQMDADGQHDVLNIPRLFQALTEEGPGEKKPDIVLGSRFMPESTPFPVSGLKQAAYAWFRFLLRRVTGFEKYLYDPTTGLQGLSRAAFVYYSKYGNFDALYPDVNMLAQMVLLQFTIRQIPAVMHPRRAGKSMHTGLLRQGAYMIHMTLSVLAVGVRSRRKQQEDLRVVQQIRERIDAADNGGGQTA
jgi:glycosyltransferase involved in cell wall biosynthesis